MTEETKPCAHRDVDREIELLHDAYDALRAMTRAGQFRALSWLQQRLDYDERAIACKRPHRLDRLGDCKDCTYPSVNNMDAERCTAQGKGLDHD